jgi:hypothetical protein
VLCVVYNLLALIPCIQQLSTCTRTYPSLLRMEFNENFIITMADDDAREREGSFNGTWAFAYIHSILTCIYIILP